MVDPFLNVYLGQRMNKHEKAKKTGLTLLFIFLYYCNYCIKLNTRIDLAYILCRAYTAVLFACRSVQIQKLRKNVRYMRN
jgi:hypothetical protein